jgi:hypothetical protein
MKPFPCLKGNLAMSRRVAWHAGCKRRLARESRVRSDGLIYVTLEVAPQGRPACAATTTYFMIQNENSEGRQEAIRSASPCQTVRSANRNWGANTCTPWPDGEDIDQIGL